MRFCEKLTNIMCINNVIIHISQENVWRNSHVITFCPFFQFNYGMNNAFNKGNKKRTGKCRFHSRNIDRFLFSVSTSFCWPKWLCSGCWRSYWYIHSNHHLLVVWLLSDIFYLRNCQMSYFKMMSIIRNYPPFLVLAAILDLWQPFCYWQ